MDKQTLLLKGQIEVQQQADKKRTPPGQIKNWIPPALLVWENPTKTSMRRRILTNRWTDRETDRETDTSMKRETAIKLGKADNMKTKPPFDPKID